jgi:hypothetical protein
VSGYDVTVTWMDGGQHTYRADDYPCTDKNGAVLHITERYGITRGVKQEWHLPVVNIRTWKADPR